MKELNKASPISTRPSALDPKNVLAHANRGAAYAVAKAHDKAFADFDAAIRLAPQFVQLYVDRANTHAAAGDYQKALADCDKRLASLPTSLQPTTSAWFYATCPEERYRDGKKAVDFGQPPAN